MDILFVSAPVFFFRFPRVSFCVNSQIIHVDGKPPLGYLFAEYGIHHHLKGRWGVGKSKEHNHRFEESFGGKECCFWFVAWFDAYVVVSSSNIEFREEGTPTQTVDHLRNEGRDVTIPLGPLVYRTIILDGSEFSVFLFNEEEICSIGTP